MKFINSLNFNHSFIKDIVRIDYSADMPLQCINDYGYSYIMFRFGDFEAYDYKNNLIEIPKIFVKGTGDFFNVKAYKNSSWISVELPNHSLHNITRLIAKKSRNKLIDLYDYVDASILDRLYYEIYENKTVEAITQTLDKHLYKFYSAWNCDLDSTVMVNYIYSRKGLLSVSELSEKFPYGERSIERMFSREVGSSPYRFIRLVRFNFIIRELEKGEYTKFEDLIERYNYYDHSHFEKDFKKFLGQSISTYKNDFNPLLSLALSREYNKI
ncbi:helix-turn-helix domain-containing protein [Psychroflexus salinarum]|uniref:Helix-turn-helix domain-containing protein n=1 Tax=Psychroflexus salinarum TaxID=546024 RepID=A0ABW3GKU5_9FLAO